MAIPGPIAVQTASQQRPDVGVSRVDLGVALGIALLAVAARIFVMRATHSTTEDFLITLRYAQNLAHGLGYAYNPGEHVLGTTAPLYTLVLAGAAALHLDAAAFGKALNVSADAGVCVALVFLFAKLGRATAGWFAALVYATTSAPVNFAVGGMETGLVTLAGALSIYAFVTARQRLMWVTLALLTLLRIDGLLLAVLLIAGWGLAGRHYDRRAVGLGLLILLPWAVFATIYFGSPIPTSLTAKLIVYGRVRSGALPNLDEFRKQFIGGPLQIVLMLGFVWGAIAAWREQPYLRMPIVWVLVYYAAMLLSKVPAFGWYFVPPLPIYYGVAVLGLQALGRSGLRAFRRSGVQADQIPVRESAIGTPTESAASRSSGSELSRAPYAALITLVLLAVPSAWHLRSIARDVSAAQALEDSVRKPLGIWLARNTAPTDRVLLEPLGYIGYYSGRPVIDLVGLVSPQVLGYYRGRSEYPLADIVVQFRPELLLTGAADAERLGLAGASGRYPEVSSSYRFVRAWPDPARGPAYFLYRRLPR